MTVRSTIVDTEVVVNGEEFYPTEMEVKLFARGATSTASVTGISEYHPFVGDTVTVKVGGDGSTATEGMTTIFRGIVDAVNLIQDEIDEIKFTARHETRHFLARTEVNRSFAGMNAIEAARQVLEDSDVDRWEIRGASTDRLLTGEYDYSKGGDHHASGVLMDIADPTEDVEIYFAHDDTVIIADYGQIGPQVSVRNLADNLIEVDAGTEIPPFNSVEVVGRSPSSEEGRDRTHMIAEDPPRAIAGEGEPRYHVKATNVTTDDEAEALAKRVLSQIKMLQQFTEVTMVGIAEVLPYTVIHMPQKLSGSTETYLATTVRHKFNSNDGYTTSFSSGLPVEAEDPDDLWGMTFKEMEEQFLAPQ